MLVTLHQADRLRHLWPALLLVASCVPAQAAAAPDPLEDTVQVPVVLDRPGLPVLRQNITVTIVHPAAHTRREPYAILLHGRPVGALAAAGLGRVQYPANARYLADLGFAVLIPTRVGYGVSGGPDVEYSGECAQKFYARAMVPVVSEVEQLLAFARGLPFVDSDRGIVIGESFGGIGAIALSDGRIRSLRGTVNISGGDGGDPAHVDVPCRPDQMSATLAGYGAVNRLPTLWMYSANDRLWGPRYPRLWFDAFRSAGGRGQFVPLPPDKNNGHYIFNRNAPAWHPAFEAFVRRLGLPQP